MFWVQVCMTSVFCLLHWYRIMNDIPHSSISRITCTTLWCRLLFVICLCSYRDSLQHNCRLHGCLHSCCMACRRVFLSFNQEQVLYWFKVLHVVVGTVATTLACLLFAIIDLSTMYWPTLLSHVSHLSWLPTLFSPLGHSSSPNLPFCMSKVSLGLS